MRCNTLLDMGIQLLKTNVWWNTLLTTKIVLIKPAMPVATSICPILLSTDSTNSSPSDSYIAMSEHTSQYFHLDWISQGSEEVMRCNTLLDLGIQLLKTNVWWNTLLTTKIILIRPKMPAAISRCPILLSTDSTNSSPSDSYIAMSEHTSQYFHLDWISQSSVSSV